MFVDLQNKYDWVLPAIVYPSVDRLIEVLEDEIIGPAQAKFPSACLDGRNDSFKDQYPKANRGPTCSHPSIRSSSPRSTSGTERIHAEASAPGTPPPVFFATGMP